MDLIKVRIDQRHFHTYCLFTTLVLLGKSSYGIVHPSTKHHEISAALVEEVNGQDHKPCLSAKTCDACLQASPQCVWCEADQDVSVQVSLTFNRDQMLLCVQNCKMNPVLYSQHNFEPM